MRNRLSQPGAPHLGFLQDFLPLSHQAHILVVDIEEEITDHLIHLEMFRGLVH